MPLTDTELRVKAAESDAASNRLATVIHREIENTPGVDTRTMRWGPALRAAGVGAACDKLRGMLIWAGDLEAAEARRILALLETGLAVIQAAKENGDG